jgi:hypothetical protein
MNTKLLSSAAAAAQRALLRQSNFIRQRLRGHISASWILPLLLLSLLPAVVQAQFTFTTNNGALTITGYTGPGGAVTIPSTTNALPVTGIGNNAFYSCYSLTSVTVPSSVTNIGRLAFFFCRNLTSITIPNSVTSIGYEAFDECILLTSVTIPDSITSIASWTFAYCSSLTNVTVPSSVTNIGSWTFYNCTSLTGVYFKGNAPSLGSLGWSVFSGDNNPTAYYLPGTTGWSTNFAGLPTALWLLPNPLILNSGPSFGVQTNGFGFIISWATNISVVVEACTNLANPIWSPVGTNTLTGGLSHFSDPAWTNYPARLYRLRTP